MILLFVALALVVILAVIMVASFIDMTNNDDPEDHNPDPVVKVDQRNANAGGDVVGLDKITID